MPSRYIIYNCVRCSVEERSPAVSGGMLDWVPEVDDKGRNWQTIAITVVGPTMRGNERKQDTFNGDLCRDCTEDILYALGAPGRVRAPRDSDPRQPGDD